MTDWIPGTMGTHRFTSVMEALKFLASNVRGIFLGGGDVGLEVGVSDAGIVVGDTEAVGSVVGDAVTSVRVHPGTRAHRQTPAAIEVTMNR